jgi:hypothetical protein
MLTRITHPELPIPRNVRRERRYWHDGSSHPGSLGCLTCPERSVCGGLQIKAGIFDCLDFCCGNRGKCDKVCRNNPDYVGRVREIANFTFDTIPHVKPIPAPRLPQAVPMLYHGASRAEVLNAPIIALPLARMFNRRDGSARHCSRESLCAAYGIAPGSLIILSGTDTDTSLERWWGFGETRRRSLIQSFRRVGVALATTPNYSLFTDVPRWDDLHSMKRIALVHHEFLSEGLPSALHVNGRTENDFRRWTDYIAERPEITHLAYEFTTGTGWAGRREKHAAWLSTLAGNVGRPLTLLVRGGIDLLPALTRAFAHVTVLETTSFMKTVKRKRAALNGRITWVDAPTDEGAPIDESFSHNIETVTAWIGQVAASKSPVTVTTH